MVGMGGKRLAEQSKLFLWQPKGTERKKNKRS